MGKFLDLTSFWIVQSDFQFFFFLQDAVEINFCRRLNSIHLYLIYFYNSHNRLNKILILSLSFQIFLKIFWIVQSDVQKVFFFFLEVKRHIGNLLLYPHFCSIVFNLLLFLLIYMRIFDEYQNINSHNRFNKILILSPSFQIFLKLFWIVQSDVQNVFFFILQDKRHSGNLLL